jgi:hypothetical protein
MAERVEPPRDAGGAPAEEKERIRRNLTLIQRAALVGLLLGALSDLATGKTADAAILVAGAGVLTLSMWLRRRGRLQLSAVVFLAFMVTVIHVLSAVGEGIHDTATILYAVSILCTALMLDRGLLVAVTVACITSVAILVSQQPSGSPDWPAVFDVSLILIVTAVAVYLLLRDVVGAGAEARIKERRLAQAYRELEARNAELEGPRTGSFTATAPVSWSCCRTSSTTPPSSQAINPNPGS